MEKISCSFATEASLYLAFMPYLKDGGLFVRSNLILPLATPIELSINKLLKEPDPIVIETSVAWLTPRGSQGNKPAGLGLQFVGENKRQLTNKIENYLAGLLKSTQPTDTM